MADDLGDGAANSDNGNSNKKRGRSKDDTGISVVLSSKPAEFIIAPKASAGSAGSQMMADGGASIIEQLRFSGVNVEIIDTLHSSGINAFDGGIGADAVLVRMDQDKGRVLQKQAALNSSAVWIDANEPMELLHGFAPSLRSEPHFRELLDPRAASTIDIRVIGEDDQPLVDAVVTVYGLGFPLHARTNANGVAQIAPPSNALGAISAIVVDPALMHWSKVVRNPAIQAGRANVVRVQSFKEFDPEFSTRGASSWGVTRLGAARSKLTGGGVKVGVIDTGCDASHPLLSHVKGGRDLEPGAATDSWKHDDNGHGTHCTGVIGAYSATSPLRGMAPAAEFYIYKVFPQASFFKLAKAMTAAIEQDIDILSMSLGSDQGAPVLVEQFERARQAGVLCVVAAGNSGNHVKFPANLATAVAGSAMGQTSTVPADSISAMTINPAYAAPNGDFSPRFTCFGDEIDFVAPGVGVIAPVPGGLKAMDGTSMATPHIAGLAALALAHDPALRNAPKNAQRVDMLVSRLRTMCAAMPWGPRRSGAGLPMLGVVAPLITMPAPFVSYPPLEKMLSL